MDLRYDPIQLGIDLTVMRLAFGKSQKQVAGILGITQSAVSKIEDGKLEVSLHVWMGYCSIFGIPFHPLNVQPELVESAKKFLEQREKRKKRGQAEPVEQDGDPAPT
jgi:transcriptional regulator with XRE-family HTH domain